MVVWAEVADFSFGFFGGAQVVEVDEALEEDLVVFLPVVAGGFVDAGFWGEFELVSVLVFWVVAGAAVAVGSPLPNV